MCPVLFQMCIRDSISVALTFKETEEGTLQLQAEGTIKKEAVKKSTVKESTVEDVYKRQGWYNSSAW